MSLPHNLQCSLFVMFYFLAKFEISVNRDGRHYTRTRSMKKDVTMMRLVVKFMDRIKNLDISLTR